MTGKGVTGVGEAGGVYQDGVGDRKRGWVIPGHTGIVSRDLEGG